MAQVKQGWWFGGADSAKGLPLLGYDDGRIVFEGETLGMLQKDTRYSFKDGACVPVKRRPKLCYRGMHASHHIVDAAGHAKHGVHSCLCDVTVTGRLDVGTDKFCGQKRTVNRMLNADETRQVANILREAVFTRLAEGIAIKGDGVPDVVRKLVGDGTVPARPSAWRQAAIDLGRTSKWGEFCAQVAMVPLPPEQGELRGGAAAIYSLTNYAFYTSVLSRVVCNTSYNEYFDWCEYTLKQAFDTVYASRQRE